MLDWKSFTRLRVYRKLRLEKNSVIALVQADGTEKTLSLAEQVVLDGVTPGTVTASKAVVVDANKDISSFRDIAMRNLTLTGNMTLSATNAITAFATGGQASAVALTTDLNRITVCATDGDSVKLPAAVAGKEVCVANFGAKKADVFPATGDAINSLAANSAVRQNSGTVVWYTCQVAGTWAAQLDVPNAKFTTRALSSSTANAGDLTGARAVTLTNTGATPGTLTTRTGAQMIADGFYTVGDSYMLRVINGQGTGTLTLAAGDGNVTITGTATMAINTWRDFVVTITGAATLTIQNAGTGTFS